VVPRTSAKSFSERVWPSCRQATVFSVGLSQTTARSAERAEKLSNVLEGSGRFRNIRENSRSFEKAGRPIYIPLYGLVVYLSGRLKVCVRVESRERTAEMLSDIM